MSFSGLYPSWVLAGSWEAGISYPTSWFDSMNHSTAPEEGAWASYLVAECNDCDPGVVVTVTHPDVPPDLVDQLRKEQSSDVGERARNVAFALAIFKSDYETNRDFLLKLLRVCLSRPRNSAEDDVCDTKLVDEIANLYWRGDAELLQPLLNAADRRDDVLGEAGGFYSDLLDRRTALVVGELRKLPEEKQRMVCEMAATDDLRFDSPKLDRVMKNLRATGDDVAERCILVLNKTTSHKP